MTYNWKLPAFFWLLLWKILKRWLCFAFLSFYKRGGGETPSEQGLFRESASDLGTSHPQRFPSWWFVLGFGFYFCCFVFGKTSIFTAHLSWSEEKGAREWQPADLCPCWVSLSSGTVREKMVFRGEGWSVWRTEMSLFGDRGTREFHRISCHLLVDTALPGEPALHRPQDQTPCLHLSKHRGEKPQRKGRKFIYIYNIKSLGD